MPWEQLFQLIWVVLVLILDVWNPAKFSQNREIDSLSLKIWLLEFTLVFKAFVFYHHTSEYFGRNHKWYEPEWWKFGDKKS